MAQAHPSLVGSKIRNWNATQVSANSRADQDVGVSCVREGGH